MHLFSVLFSIYIFLIGKIGAVQYITLLTILYVHIYIRCTLLFIKVVWVGGYVGGWMCVEDLAAIPRSNMH